MVGILGIMGRCDYVVRSDNMFVIRTWEIRFGADNRELFLESAEGPNNSFVYDDKNAMIFGTRTEADKMMGHESLKHYTDLEVVER